VSLWTRILARNYETCSFSLHNTLIDGLECCGLQHNYCDVFISCLDSFWRHPFTAEDPLVGDVMLNFSKSVLMKKQPHLHLGWPECEYMLIFGWTILLRQSLSFKKNHVHVVLCLARSLCTNADLSLARTDKPCRRIGTTVWSRYARVGRVCRVWGSTFCLVTFSADVFSFSTIL